MYVSPPGLLVDVILVAFRPILLVVNISYGKEASQLTVFERDENIP